jgi:hypothetical protein
MMGRSAGPPAAINTRIRIVATVKDPMSVRRTVRLLIAFLLRPDCIRLLVIKIFRPQCTSMSEEGLP